MEYATTINLGRPGRCISPRSTMAESKLITQWIISRSCEVKVRERGGSWQRHVYLSGGNLPKTALPGITLLITGNLIIVIPDGRERIQIRQMSLKIPATSLSAVMIVIMNRMVWIILCEYGNIIMKNKTKQPEVSVSIPGYKLTSVWTVSLKRLQVLSSSIIVSLRFYYYHSVLSSINIIYAF